MVDLGIEYVEQKDSVVWENVNLISGHKTKTHQWSPT
jgi:hypothetical protein